MTATSDNLERNSQITKGVYEFCRVAKETKPGDEEQLGKVCLQIAQDITGSKFGFISEVNAAGRHDTIALSDPGWAECRMGSKAPKLIQNMEVRGIWGWVIKNGSPLICNDPAHHPDSVGTPPGHPALVRFLGVPLQDQGKTFGMIALANKQSNYQVEDLQAVTQLAERLSLVFRIRWSFRKPSA